MFLTFAAPLFHFEHARHLQPLKDIRGQAIQGLMPLQRLADTITGTKQHRASHHNPEPWSETRSLCKTSHFGHARSSDFTFVLTKEVVVARDSPLKTRSFRHRDGSLTSHCMFLAMRESFLYSRCSKASGRNRYHVVVAIFGAGVQTPGPDFTQRFGQ
jgi:hypothetical protein